MEDSPTEAFPKMIDLVNRHDSDSIYNIEGVGFLLENAPERARSSQEIHGLAPQAIHAFANSALGVEKIANEAGSPVEKHSRLEREFDHSSHEKPQIKYF